MMASNLGRLGYVRSKKAQGCLKLSKVRDECDKLGDFLLSNGYFVCRNYNDKSSTQSEDRALCHVEQVQRQLNQAFGLLVDGDLVSEFLCLGGDGTVVLDSLVSHDGISPGLGQSKIKKEPTGYTNLAASISRAFMAMSRLCFALYFAMYMVKKT
jgi:hypothetical protein